MQGEIDALHLHIQQKNNELPRKEKLSQKLGDDIVVDLAEIPKKIEKKKDMGIIKEGQYKIVPRNDTSKCIGNDAKNKYEYANVGIQNCRRWVALGSCGGSSRSAKTSTTSYGITKANNKQCRVVFLDCVTLTNTKKRKNRMKIIVTGGSLRREEMTRKDNNSTAS